MAGVLALGYALCLGTFATLFYPTELRGIGVGSAMAFAQSGAVVGPYVGGLPVAVGLSTLAVFLLSGRQFSGALAVKS